MAVLLSIETTSTEFSVALHDDETLLNFQHVSEPRSASSLLVITIRNLLNKSSIHFKQLSAVVISDGPGSYTGLRIGAATAKGICYAMNIPLIAVNALEIMAANVAPHVPDNSLLCPMIDARRMEVYCLLTDRHFNILEPTQAKIIDVNSFHDYLKHHNIYFFGDGAQKCQTVLQHSHAHFIQQNGLSAITLGSLGLKKWQQQNFSALDSYQPNYLKEFMIKKSVKQ